MQCHHCAVRHVGLVLKQKAFTSFRDNVSYAESIILPPVISAQTTRTDSVIFTDTGSSTSFEVYIWLKCVSQTLIKSMSLCAVTWKNWGLSGSVASVVLGIPVFVVQWQIYHTSRTVANWLPS